MVSTDGVQHHLRIVVTTDKNAFAVFIVHDVKSTVCDDHTVAGPESLRNEVAVIQPFLHHDQRMRTSLLNLLHCRDDELGIDVGVGIHLLVVELGGRPPDTLVQMLAELVLAQRMGGGSLLGIHRGFIGEVLLQPGGWRTVQPPLRAGSRQDCVYFWHNDLP